MSDSYTKLFSSITASTIWGESYSTRIVWVTLLAMADSKGEVYASVPGLARIANVSREETDVALAAFHAPDPDSRTSDNEGRRIETIDGGWRLLNHAKFSRIRDAQERRAYMRNLMADKRAREKQTETPDTNETVSSVSTVSNQLADLAELAPPALTPTPDKEKKDQEIGARSAKRGTRLSPEWMPSAALVVWANCKRPDVGLDEEIEKFRDWWAAKAGAGGCKLDWDATFRTWVRRATATGANHGNRTPSRKPSAVEQVEQAIRDRRAREADARAATG